jgi:site-specific DNA recombinase
MNSHRTMKRPGSPSRNNLELLSADWRARSVQEPQPVRRPRAVIYARYSTSNQDEDSITRQIESAERYIEKIGAELVMPADRFTDRALSGAYIVTRDGLNDLLSSVARGVFDLVVVEDADRLSRDLGHLGEMHRTLEHHGVELHASMRGKLGLAEIAMYGFLSAEQRAQLKIRTKAGAKQAAEQGRAPKGFIYGYSSAPQGRGYLVVNVEQAAIVHLIFTMFDEGVPVRAIVRHLNREGIPSPQGKQWSAAGLRGSAKEGSGLLRNHRYKGVLFYNRTETRRHPETGKRTLLMRPEEDWVVVEVPEWQIVDTEMWERAQERLAKTGTGGVRIRTSGTHDQLLPGRIHCTCGARMTSVVKRAAEGRRLQCSAYVEKGTCSIGHSVGQAYVERNILRMVRDGVVNEQTVEAFEAAYREEARRLAADVEAERATLETKAAKLDRDIDRTWDKAAMSGFSTERVSGWRARWESELAELRERLRCLPRLDRLPKADASGAATLRGAMSELILRIPSPLQSADDQRLLAAIRALVPRVELTFAKGGRGYTLRVDARLDGLLPAAERTPAVVPVARRLEAAFGPTEWGRMADPDRRDEVTKMAQARVHGLRDHQWLAIAHIFDAVDLRAVRARDVVDAALFHLRTLTPLSKLPSCYGHPKTVRGALQRFVGAGLWHDAVDELGRLHDAVVVQGDRTAFDRWKAGPDP